MSELLVGTPGLQIVLRSTLHRPRCEFPRSPQPSFTIRLIRHYGPSDGQSEHDFSVHDPTSHITNTGRIIEDMEIKMRGQLQEVCRSFYSLPFSLFRLGHRPSWLLSPRMISVPPSRVTFYTLRPTLSIVRLSVRITIGNTAYQTRPTKLLGKTYACFEHPTNMFLTLPPATRF